MPHPADELVEDIFDMDESIVEDFLSILNTTSKPEEL
jgi:hypothetical protein